MLCPCTHVTVLLRTTTIVFNHPLHSNKHISISVDLRKFWTIHHERYQPQQDIDGWNEKWLLFSLLWLRAP